MKRLNEGMSLFGDERFRGNGDRRFGVGFRFRLDASAAIAEVREDVFGDFEPGDDRDRRDESADADENNDRGDILQRFGDKFFSLRFSFL